MVRSKMSTAKHHPKQARVPAVSKNDTAQHIDPETTFTPTESPTPVGDDAQAQTLGLETSANKDDAKARQQAERELIASLQKQIAEVREKMVELGVPFPGIVKLKLGGEKAKGWKKVGGRKTKAGKGVGKKKASKVAKKSSKLKLGEEEKGGWRLKAA